MVLKCVKCGATFVADSMDVAKINDLMSPQTIHVNLDDFLCINCYLNAYATTATLKKQRLDLNLDIDKIEKSNL